MNKQLPALLIVSFATLKLINPSEFVSLSLKRKYNSYLIRLLY